MTRDELRHRVANHLERWANRIRPELNTPGQERDWNITADVDPELTIEQAIDELFEALIPQVGGSMDDTTVNVRFTTRGLSNLRIERW